MFELLGTRKPAETHRIACAAPADREKELCDPVKNVHLQLQSVEKRLTRSSLCDRSTHHYRSHSEVVKVKRTMSAPSISIVHDHDVHFDRPTVPSSPYTNHPF